MRHVHKMFVMLAAAVLLAVLAWSLRGPFGSLIANHWRTQLDAATAERAELMADRLTQLGAPGIHALVDALGSDRETVATAARRALWAELERWESLTAPAITRNLAVLAEALSQSAIHFEPAARREAAGLATEVLRWLPESDAPARLAVIAHCDRVFEYAAAEQLPEAPITSGKPLFRGEASPDEAARSSTSPVTQRLLEPPEMPSVVSAPPGGGLPIETFPIPSFAARVADESNAGPRPHAAETDANYAAGAFASGPAELLLPGGPMLPVTPNEPYSRAPRPPDLPDGIDDTVATAVAEPEAADEADSHATEVLMRWLHSADATVAARAEAALRRRGFTDVHVELARRLFDADPAVRVELARTLPKLTSVDPVPWLLWLSRDPRVEVRLAAIGLMATTADPALLARVRQMARDDSDASVQHVARKLEER